MIVLDTHSLLWLRCGDRRLGAFALRETERAWQADALAVSAISYWEIGMLTAKKRIAMTMDVQAWRRENLAQGVYEIPIDGAICIRAAELDDFHGDPADRHIVSTALEGGHQLVTADSKILHWHGPLRRLDAAK